MMSTGIWIFICLCLLIVKYGFLQPLEDRKLYKLYEARDNVAIAAIEGKISQDSKEYLFVIKSINFALYYMKNNYDFSIVFKNILLQPEKIQKYFSDIYGLVEQYDFLQKNYNISTAYFQKSLNVRLFFLIHFIIQPIYYILCFVLLLLRFVQFVSKAGTRITSSVNNRISVISKINRDYNSYKSKNFA